MIYSAEETWCIVLNIFTTPDNSLYSVMESRRPYLKPVFDCLYYTGLSPIRFSTLPNKRGFVIYEARAQKIIHILVATLITLIGLNTLRFAWLTQGPIVIFYFQITCQFLNFCLKPASFYLFWKRRELLLKCIHKINSCPLLSQSGNKVHLLGIFLCLFCILRAVLTSLSGQSVMLGEDWTPSLLLDSHLAKARYTFGASSNFELPASNMSTVCSLDALFMTALITAEFLQTTHYYLLTIYLQLSALTLYEATNSFSKSLKEINQKYPNSALEDFYELKSLSNALNEALGSIIIILPLFYGLYLSTDLDNIFIPTHWMLKCVFIMDFLDPIIFVILCAEACLANDRLRSWLTDPDNYGAIPKDKIKLRLLLDELRTKPVGIRGKEKFVIDYTFVGHVSVVILTLFVVVLQSKYPK